MKQIDNLLVKNYWETIENERDRPKFANELKIISYSDFKGKFSNLNDLKSLINSIYDGDIYIVKNSFDKSFVEKVKNDFQNFVKSKESSFHKMKENCPDFHRIIDENVSGLYSIKALKHSAYFFPWNGDENNLFPVINKRWRYLKIMGGRKYNEFENNTPKDGIVDRIQVLKYPPGGSLETHCDPYHNQRTFISIYMSTRGEDYKSGGFYVIDKKNNKLDLENYISSGDIGFGYASIMHGVDKIDGLENCEWDTNKGRWFIGLYSNDSDEVKNRVTSKTISPNAQLGS